MNENKPMNLTTITIEIEARAGLPGGEYELMANSAFLMAKITASNIAAIKGITRVWVMTDDETAVYHGA